MNRIAVIGMAGNSAFLPIPAFCPPGETVKAESVHFEPGGKGMNQAVAAARAGAAVSFLAAVGKNADPIRSFLKQEGIRAFLCEKEGQSAFAAILTDRAGANSVTVYQGPALTLADAEAFQKEIEESDVLLLNNEVPEEVNLCAAKIAKKAGVFVLINPAPGRATAKELFSLADLFVPNEFEDRFVKSAENRIVTLGSEGCLFAKTGRRIPAYPVKKVVDTTGAGDTFCGYLAAGIANGIEPEKAAEYAVKASGVSTGRRYAASSVPTKEEVDSL